jgi:hypothetical protein
VTTRRLVSDETNGDSLVTTHFVAATIRIYLVFFKSTKDILSVRRAWDSPNTLFTMVLGGQAFCITRI